MPRSKPVTALMIERCAELIGAPRLPCRSISDQANRLRRVGRLCATPRPPARVRLRSEQLGGDTGSDEGGPESVDCSCAIGQHDMRTFAGLSEAYVEQAGSSRVRLSFITMELVWLEHQNRDVGLSPLGLVQVHDLDWLRPGSACSHECHHPQFIDLQCEVSDCATALKYPDGPSELAVIRP